VRVSPALGDDVPVPSQRSVRLDEEVPETPAGKQTCRSRQYRPIRLFQRRSMNLAPQDRHLVAHHDDLDGDIGVTAEDESDQLQDAT